MKQILFAYTPVLHRGYQEFFAKYQNAELYLLDREELLGFEELEYLKKDIRVLDLSLAIKAIKSWNIFNVVKSIKISELEQFIDSSAESETQLIFTNDDIGNFVADKFFAQAKNKFFEPIFLRWDKNLMSQQNEVSSDMTISKTAFEQKIMIKAFKQAGRSSDWWRHVGSLIIKDGQILLAGYNKHLPSEDQQYKNSDPRISFISGVGSDFSSSIHAEANLIALAAKKGISLDGAEMFITTFPCPVCAKQIAVSGIKKIYYAKGYAVLDGLEILQSHEVEVILVKFPVDEFAQIEKMEQERSIVKNCYNLS
jgi:dCMP deaminase